MAGVEAPGDDVASFADSFTCSTTARCTQYFASLLWQNGQLPFNGGCSRERELFCNASTGATGLTAVTGSTQAGQGDGRFAVGEYQIGRITGRPGSISDFRSGPGNAVRAVAFAGLDLAIWAGWPRRLPCHRGES